MPDGLQQRCVVLAVVEKGVDGRQDAILHEYVQRIDGALEKRALVVSWAGRSAVAITLVMGFSRICTVRVSMARRKKYFIIIEAYRINLIFY